MRVWVTALVLLLAASVHAAEQDRFVSKLTLPTGKSVVVAEGDFDARSIGSFSVRLYKAAAAPDETTFFTSGLIRAREGVIEKVILADVDGDQLGDVVPLELQLPLHLGEIEGVAEQGVDGVLLDEHLDGVAEDREAGDPLGVLGIGEVVDDEAAVGVQIVEGVLLHLVDVPLLHLPGALDPTPPAAATTYKVWDNGTLRNDLRVSLSEMIDYAEGRVPNAIAIDVRGSASNSSYVGFISATGSTFGTPPSPNLPFSADSTVFEGQINGAKAMVYSNLYNASAAGLLFKDPDTIKSYFTDVSVGLDSTKTAYVYCKVGFMGAVPFFALDGILGWPVAFYDGSWSQWGMLSGNAAMGGMLDSNSKWRTDIASRTDPSTMKYSYADNNAQGRGTCGGNAASRDA